MGVDRRAECGGRNCPVEKKCSIHCGHLGSLSLILSSNMAALIAFYSNRSQGIPNPPPTKGRQRVAVNKYAKRTLRRGTKLIS